MEALLRLCGQLRSLANRLNLARELRAIVYGALE